MRSLKRLVWVVLAGLVLAGAAGSWVAWNWLEQPLQAPDGGAEVTVPAGSTARSVARTVEQAGVRVSAQALFVWMRLSGTDRRIQAGTYLFEPGLTPRQLVDKMVRGEQALVSLTLLEGWTFSQVRQALAAHPHLTQTLAGASDVQVMAALDRAGLHPEGRFFPDTYAFVRGTRDVEVLRQALRAMEEQLAAAWTLRSASTVVSSPEQALILASIIEKETGIDSDRPIIGGVFSNRLRIGMRLQTDPTVIYGMGTRFDGNLRRADLLADTPWNTYTRAGLPPTPIAMPGRASLLAAVQPADTPALYFVARGDGSSQFSVTLAEHNAAVNRYQRGQ